MPEHLDRISDSLARDSSRRGFLARVGGALMAITAARTVGSLIEPGESDAFHFCGHTFTTGSCPHPTGLPRIDSRGYPLRASDGRPIDDIGRPVNEAGQPVDDDGQLLKGTGRATPAARPADADLRSRPGHLRNRDEDRRGVVPLLRGQGPQARRLLLPSQHPDQWGRGADRLLLRRPQGLLRPVLRHQGAVLMFGPLEIALGVAALLIGATGTFSPCGLSVIDTIGPTGHTGGRRTTIAACVAFLPGAIAGGLLTFGSLAALGDLLHGAGGRASYLVAAAIALLAAALEVRGTRIVPQIRRQLPEHWRRVMPMAMAAALYGVLLGIGFTTFVLTFGVWALAGVSLAVGDPALGLLLGACFGLGRALPILALAPLAGRSAGIRATELMCERPGVYLGLRRGDAAALTAAALALIIVPGSAGAAGTSVAHATDPSATADALLFQRLGGPAVIRRGGPEVPLPGSHPAIGGRFVATVQGDSVLLFDRGTLAPIGQIPAPGADAIAVSDSWLAYRISAGGGNAIYIRYIANPAAPAPPLRVASLGGAGQLSPPAVDGNTLLYTLATPPGESRGAEDDGNAKAPCSGALSRLLLFDPSVRGRSFAYVRTDARRSRLMVRRRQAHGAGRVLLSLGRSKGVLWSNALTGSVAYATIMQPSSGNPDATIVGVSRRHPKRFHQRGPRGGGNHRF